MSEETLKRSDLLGTLRTWQAQDLEQANQWLEENRVLFRNAVLHNREEARSEAGRRLIQARAQYN
jgi:hypothetical protein